MNSQFFPGANESLNKAAHEQLLTAASAARRIRKPAEASRQPAFKYSPRFRQPRLLEPLLSAVLTAAVAIQVAVLVAF